MFLSSRGSFPGAVVIAHSNEELTQNRSAENERLELLQSQITEVDSRLGKLYDALETGEFKRGELAPRIQTLFEKKEQLLKLYQE